MSFDIEASNFKLTGIHISSTKIVKLGSKSFTNINFTLSTKKNAKAGLSKYIIPVKVQDGGRYFFEVVANVNVPEICLSEEYLDFGEVLVGKRKTISIEIKNEKELPCDWFTS